MILIASRNTDGNTDVVVEMIYDFETTKSRLILLRDISWNPCSSYHAPSRILSAQTRNYFSHVLRTDISKLHKYEKLYIDHSNWNVYMTKN